jgi:hypothetical protein
MPPRALLLLAVLPLAACDETEDGPDAVTFDGVTYEALGRATLDVTAGGLVVGRGDGAGEYGVRVDFDALEHAAFRVEPVEIPATGRWGLQLFGDVEGVDDDRTALATAWADGVSDSTHQINFDFAPSLGVSSLTVEYYLDGQLLYRVPGVPLGSDAGPGGAGRLLVTTVGEGERGPGSVHIIRDGTRYIVATDYGGDAPRTGAGGCAGILLRVDLPGVPREPFCTDYVQAIPDQFEGLDAVESLEIRARAVASFTLTSGDVTE